LLLLLLADAGRRCHKLVLLLLLIVSIAFSIPCTSLLAWQPARLSLTDCSSSSSCLVRFALFQFSITTIQSQTCERNPRTQNLSEKTS
jgi:hypothetical protein